MYAMDSMCIPLWKEMSEAEDQDPSWRRIRELARRPARDKFSDKVHAAEGADDIEASSAMDRLIDGNKEEEQPDPPPI